MKRTLLALAALLLHAAALSAQAGPRPVVDVVATGTPTILAAMADRIRSLEARFPVTVRWTTAEAIDVREIVAPRAADQGAFARVWLDMSNPDRAVLFIANAGHDRLLVRVVPATDGYGELTRESLATIVESAIDALLAGGQIGVDRGAAVHEIEAQTGTRVAAEPPPAVTVVTAQPPKPVVPSPSHAASHPRSWLLAGYYRGDAISSGPALRHGMQLALAYSSPSRAAFELLLMVSAQYAPPFSLGDGGRQVAEHGGGARLAIGATTNPERSFVWRAAIGAGADISRVEPVIAADTGLSAADPFVVTTPITTAFAMGSLRPARWLDIGLGVGLDVPLTGHHYDVQTGTARSAVIAPWSVHPYAFLGIGMPLALGAER